MKKMIFKISMILSLLILSINGIYADVVYDIFDINSYNSNSNSSKSSSTYINDNYPIITTIGIIAAIVCIIAFLVLTLNNKSKVTQKTQEKDLDKKNE